MYHIRIKYNRAILSYNFDFRILKRVVVMFAKQQQECAETKYNATNVHLD